MTAATAITETASPMETIEHATKAYADARDELRERMDSLTELIERVKRRRMPGLRTSLRRLTQARDELHALLEAHPELFERPKTRTMHGVRVGWMKQKGKLTFVNADQVVELIERQLPQQAESLITIKKAPVKKALADLSATDLKRIGVQVEADTDVPFIRPTDSELDKLIDALLAESEEVVS